jgi:hypothetical protein
MADFVYPAFDEKESQLFKDLLPLRKSRSSREDDEPKDPEDELSLSKVVTDVLLHLNSSDVLKVRSALFLFCLFTTR